MNERKSFNMKKIQIKKRVISRVVLSKFKNARHFLFFYYCLFLLLLKENYRDFFKGYFFGMESCHVIFM